MLKAGADVNILTKRGCTPLSEAVRRQNMSLVEALVEAGADTKRTLFALTIDTNVQHVDVLIQLGADINVCNEYGNNLLFVANTGWWRDRHFELCVLLLKNGIYINQLKNSGRNALQELKETGPRSLKIVVDLLLAASEKLDVALSCSLDTDVLFCQRIDVTQPKPTLLLLDICRVAIRNHLVELDSPVNLFIKVSRLGLPTILVDYLLLTLSC